MTTVQKLITITEAQGEWINDKIAKGQFVDESDCVRALIRREQYQVEDIVAIRAALIEGEERGEPQPFDRQAFMDECRAQDA